MRTFSRPVVLNPMKNFLRRVDRLQNIEIFDCNHLLMEQGVADPFQQALPVVASDKNHGKRFDFARLDQRNRLEEFVERSESAGQNQECDRVLHKHDFSNEEISEVEKFVRVD